MYVYYLCIFTSPHECGLYTHYISFLTAPWLCLAVVEEVHVSLLAYYALGFAWPISSTFLRPWKYQHADRISWQYNLKKIQAGDQQDLWRRLDLLAKTWLWAKRKPPSGSSRSWKMTKHLPSRRKETRNNIYYDNVPSFSPWVNIWTKSKQPPDQAEKQWRKQEGCWNKVSN